MKLLTLLAVLPVAFADITIVCSSDFYPLAPQNYSAPTGSVVKKKDPVPASPTSPLTATNASPGPSVHFDAFTGVDLPPDNAGAVGPSQVVTMLNGHVIIKNRTGTTTYLNQSLLSRNHAVGN